MQYGRHFLTQPQLDDKEQSSHQMTSESVKTQRETINKSK